MDGPFIVKQSRLKRIASRLRRKRTPIVTTSGDTISSRAKVDLESYDWGVPVGGYRVSSVPSMASALYYAQKPSEGA